MTRPPFGRGVDRRPATSRQRWTTVCAALAAAAFASNLAASWRDDRRHVLAAGDHLPLETQLHNGQAHEVLLPGTAVEVRVGRPVREIDQVLVDLGTDRDWSDDAPVPADDGVRLVPVAWSARPVNNSAGQEVADQEIDVHLVAGERRVELARGTGRELASETVSSDTAVLVAADEDQELVVEVTFDGLTQRIDVTTGELDRGAAEGLSARPQRIDSPCPDARPCQLQTGAAWRPHADRATLSTGALAPYAWDDELGWADEGRHWAEIALRPSVASYAVDRAGAPRQVVDVGELEVTLDGQEPRRSEALEGGETYSSARYGSAVFAVDDDATPRELRVSRTLHLEGGASPSTVRVTGRYPLERD
ncbi:hypothetical protein [Janibacter indicus]|uniref:hypothetical protein n=1 Tax=Janibacter indicus TaxID=857417 RepID=UPI003EBB341D